MNVLKTDFDRAIKNPRFFLSILLLFLTWLINSERFVIKYDVLFLFVHVKGRTIMSLLSLVIVSVIFVTAYVEDTENNLLRYCILRVNVKEYVLSKVIVCFTTAFAATCIGSTLFLLSQLTTLPLVAENSITVRDFQGNGCFGGLLLEHPICYIAIHIILDGLCLGSMSVLALSLSTFMRNTYAVYILPFLLNFCFYYGPDIVTRGALPNIEDIYASIFSTRTDNVLLFWLMAAGATVMFVGTGYLIMLKRVRSEFR